MLYHLHEYNRALLSPVVTLARAGADMFSAPGSWLAQLPGANRVAAAYELLYRVGKDYEKPAWDIDDVNIGRRLDGIKVPVVEQAVLKSRSAGYCTSNATAMTRRSSPS